MRGRLMWAVAIVSVFVFFGWFLLQIEELYEPTVEKQWERHNQIEEIFQKPGNQTTE